MTTIYFFIAEEVQFTVTDFLPEFRNDEMVVRAADSILVFQY
jgi:hypothetical protein